MWGSCGILKVWGHFAVKGFVSVRTFVRVGAFSSEGFGGIYL